MWSEQLIAILVASKVTVQVDRPCRSCIPLRARTSHVTWSRRTLGTPGTYTPAVLLYMPRPGWHLNRNKTRSARGTRMGLFRERRRDFGWASRRLRKAPGALRNIDRESFMSLLTYFKVIDTRCCKPILKIDTKCGRKKRKSFPKLLGNFSQSHKTSPLLLKPRKQFLFFKEKISGIIN